MSEPGIHSPAVQSLDATYRRAVAAAGIGLCRLTPEGRVLFIDEEALRIFGAARRYASPEEALGRPLDALRQSLGAEAALQEALQAHGAAERWAYPFRTLDGETRWAQIDARAVTDPESGRPAFEWLLRDVSAWKLGQLEEERVRGLLQEQVERRSQELLETHARLRGVLDSTLDAIMAFRAVRDETSGQAVDLEWSMVNPAGEDLTGRTAAELLGRRLSATEPELVASGILQRYLDVVETGRSASFETRYDSDFIHGWFLVQAVKMGDGCVLSVSDITAQKTTEGALRESRERYRQLFDNINDAIFVSAIDADRQEEVPFSEVNRVACELLGYSREELLQMTPGQLVVPDAQPALRAGRDELAAGGRALFEVRVRRRDGTELPVEVHSQAFTLGPERRLLSVVRDVRERKAAEAALQETHQLNQLLLDSLPHPAMLVDRDRTVLAANRIAREAGAVPGVCCWEGFGHLAYIPAEDRAYVEAHGEPPPGGTRCTFCRADECLDAEAPANDPRVCAFDRYWDTHWVPLDDGTYLHYAIDITEREEAERRRREHEQLLRTVLESMPVGVFVLGPEGDLVSANAAAKDLWESEDLAERLGACRAWHAASGRPLGDADWPGVRASRGGETVLGEELEIETFSGHRRHVRSSAVPLRDPEGVLTGAVCLQWDVTEQRRAAEAVADAHAMLQHLIDAVPDLIFFKDGAGTYLGCNQAFAAFVGRSKEEIAGVDDRELFPPHVASFFREQDRKAREEGASRRNTEWVSYPDGGRVLLDTAKTPFRHGDGEAPGIIGVSRDITESHRLQERLRRSEERYRALFTHTRDMLFLAEVGPDGRVGRFVDVNPVACERLGYTREELLELTPADLDVRATEPAVLEALASEGHCRVETVLRGKDGAEVPVDNNVTVFPFGEGRLALGLARDVTQRRQLEEELRLLSLFPQANPNLTLRLDRSGTITYANPAAQAWLAERGLPPIGLYHLLPDDFTARLYRAMESGETSSAEIEDDGRWYDFKLRPFPGEEACLVTLTDITDLKQVSLEREIYYQAYRHSIHGVTVTDPEGRILHVNPAFEELYGYTAEEARGETPAILNPGRETYRDLGYTDEEYDRLFAGMWQRILDPQTGHWEGELVNRAKDGRLLYVYLFISAIRDSQGEIAGFVGMPMDITRRREEELGIRIECYRAITELAETRDNETGAHLNRLAAYAGLLAEHLGRPRKYVEDVRLFAPLHDIGKVGIPDQILLAPRKLTDEEFAVMRTHATLGYEILKEVSTLEMAADIAHGHHERWDGKGYPRGLAGEEVPLAARLVAVCDVYDALRSERPYKQPWPHEKAAAVIREGRGSQFDPAVVDAFLALEGEFRRISEEMREPPATPAE
jgi:PAS domain S-box-containing protein